MKTIRLAMLLILSSVILAGCGTASREIQSKSQSERADVFTEVTDSQPVPSGFAYLVIKANIKTHLEGYYVLESKSSLHGKEKYPFLVNIDGQAARWEVAGIKDVKPSYDAEGKTSLDPEAGSGIKYVIEKRLRLSAGRHQIFFCLPEDNYFIEIPITFNKGESSVLEFKPIYRAKRIPTRIPSFEEELTSYEVFLNGSKLQ